jgi:tetratricopeptide (TPR) repeat protein
MELTIDRYPLDPDSHFLFWKPGSVPYSEPAGLSWRLDPGNLLVLNTHIRPTGRVETVSPTVGLHFTDEPPNRLPLLMQLEADRALDIPAGDKDFTVSDSFRLPVDVDVLAIYPHAHYLGKLLEAYATLPDGQRKWLIRIPQWNFDQQAVYRYRTPMPLPAGSVIWMRFHYDNSGANPRNPNNPPKRVQAGNQGTDEMAHLWLQVLPHGPGDRRRAIQEALMRHRLEKDANDFTAYLNLGAIRLSLLDAQGAVTALRTAVRLDPISPEAHGMLGSALLHLGRVSEGIDQFRAALSADPEYIEARYNLAISLGKRGEFAEAIRDLRDVAAAFPSDATIQNQLGTLLARSGSSAEALQCFEKALELEPSNEDAKHNREILTRELARKPSAVGVE